jgi:hypothetical protein
MGCVGGLEQSPVSTKEIAGTCAQVSLSVSKANVLSELYRLIVNMWFGTFRKHTEIGIDHNVQLP